MSKSGLHGLFGSKEELQLATFEKAVESFVREVWLPVAGLQRGLPRLHALLDRWIDYHERGVLPGGCLVTTATIEFDARHGPLRDAVLRARSQMHAVLEADLRAATDAGDLPADTDPADTAFTLYALASAASQAIQLDEPRAGPRGRRAPLDASAAARALDAVRPRLAAAAVLAHARGALAGVAPLHDPYREVLLPGRPREREAPHPVAADSLHELPVDVGVHLHDPAAARLRKLEREP